MIDMKKQLRNSAATDAQPMCTMISAIMSELASPYTARVRCALQTRRIMLPMKRPARKQSIPPANAFDPPRSVICQA